MSLNIKIGPSERDESSNEDSSNTVAPYSHHPKTTENHCSICLGEITNACYTNTCIHMFCFDCLKTWSAISSTCPLCKKSFQQIHHSLTEFTHVTYEIPRRESPETTILLEIINNTRNNLFMNTIRSNNGSSSPVHVYLSRDGRIEHHDDPYTQNIVTTMRTRVYRQDLWAEPLPDSSGQFRDCSPTFLSENPAQVNRLQYFISRDVHAIATIERSRINININEIDVIDLIMQSILRHEIRDEHTINLLLPYFGPHTVHFTHELYNFASSPLDLSDYDVNVHFTQQPSHSSTHQNALREIRENNILDQPSTSTGIQDSVYQPNNRYNLRSRTNQQSETILLGSDDSIIGVESRQYPNDVTIQSSGDNNGVENPSPPLHPIEEFSSSRN